MRDWLEDVRQQLAVEVARVRRLVTTALRGEAGEAPPPPWEPANPTPLDYLCATLDLSRAERDLLVLAAGCELDAELAELCRLADAAGPTVGLSLSAIPGATWAVWRPVGPLRALGLIDLDASSPSLVKSTFRIRESLLFFLLDGGYADPSLLAVLTVEPPTDRESPEGLDATLAAGRKVQIVGGDASARREAAVSATTNAGLVPWTLQAHSLPAANDLAGFDRSLRLLRLLTAATLIVDDSDPDNTPAQSAAVRRYLQSLDGPAVLCRVLPLSSPGEGWETFHLD